MFSFVFRTNMLVFLKYYCTFVTLSSNNGALAHLARAFDWQSRGGRFESCMLHTSFFFPLFLAIGDEDIFHDQYNLHFFITCDTRK